MGGPETVPVVTIDGPAGAGKSTVAALIAKRFDYHLLISGSLYRALALLAIERRLNVEDVPALIALVARMRIEFSPSEGATRVRLNGHDVTAALGEEGCAAFASRVAEIPQLRAELLGYQHTFRRLPGLVAEGRDMGTVVFPGAKVKIFLSADLEERARRRLKQLNDGGLNGNFADLYRRLAARDERDKNRSVAPLKPANNTALIDTTGKSIAATVQEIEILVKKTYA